MDRGVWGRVLQLLGREARHKQKRQSRENKTKMKCVRVARKPP